jgi:ATP-dependent exoDNAse (exonuclease V) beta subunit
MTMTQHDVLEALEVFNDDKFKFNPDAHRYTYNGDVFTSVTTLIGKFHEPFDSDKWSKIKAEQRGISQDEILNEWQQLNDYANEVGTGLHNWAENYWNKEYQPLPTCLDTIHRINKFNVLYAQHLHKLTPIVMEKMVFHPKWKLAGMIDGLFLYKDMVFIGDYKTNKVFKDDNHPKGTYNKLLPPFDNLFENHHNEYSIQLSLYSLILKEMCGINIKKKYLIYIGPDNNPGKIYTALDLEDTLKAYLDSDEYLSTI